MFLETRILPWLLYQGSEKTVTHDNAFFNAYFLSCDSNKTNTFFE